MRGADVLVFCTPHQFTRDICRQLRGHVDPNAVAISLTKVSASFCGMACTGVLYVFPSQQKSCGFVVGTTSRSVDLRLTVAGRACASGLRAHS